MVENQPGRASIREITEPLKLLIWYNLDVDAVYMKSKRRGNGAVIQAEAERRQGFMLGTRRTHH